MKTKVILSESKANKLILSAFFPGNVLITLSVISSQVMSVIGLIILSDPKQKVPVFCSMCVHAIF